MAEEHSLEKRRPLEADEVLIHVPPGYGKNVKVVETKDAGKNAEITVQVSKKRVAGRTPVLGVIVK
ncbi:MAG: hypothetical protein AABN33_06680 [Acidobacteriota bacterium]